MADKFVTLMILSQSTAKVSTFRFRKRTLTAVGAILIAFIGFSSFLAVSFATHTVEKADLSRLQERNRILNDELARLRESLFAQESQMTEHVAIEESLRLAANLEPIPEEVRMMGVGGSRGYTADYTRVLADGEKAQLTMISEKADQLLRQTRLQKSSLMEIEKAFESNRDLWARVPSIRPVESGYVSSGFGQRPDPFTGKMSMHCGVDYCAHIGEPVHATADGKVIKAKIEGGFGKIVVIDHGNGLVTRYAHNSELKVSKGQEVRRGDVIALVGRSGRATAPHVHYEVQRDGVPVNPLDFVLSKEFIVD